MYNSDPLPFIDNLDPQEQIAELRHRAAMFESLYNSKCELAEKLCEQITKLESELEKCRYNLAYYE